MYEVTVEDTFAAGHYLRNYKGKCENPHGHNYKVRVTLAGKELDRAGLLLDFKDLREVMKHVIDRLDHQMINDIAPFTELNPSAENLAKYFYDETNGRLKSVTNGRVFPVARYQLPVRSRCSRQLWDVLTTFLQGPGCLAEGDGACNCDLSSVGEVSERRGVWTDFTTAPCGFFDPD